MARAGLASGRDRAAAWPAAAPDRSGQGAVLAIRLFGALEARHDHRRLPDPRRRSTARLLAFLAWHAGAALPRRAVAEGLWPDMSTPDALAELRRNLHELATHLAEATGRDGWLEATRRTVALAPADDVHCDAVAFVRLCRGGLSLAQDDPVSAAAALEEAVALHHAELLADWDDEWIEGPRRAVRDLLGEALAALVRLAEAGGTPRAALGHARRLVALDPLHESAHRSLMRLHARAGDRAAALAQFEALRDVLRAELDVEPGAATLRLLQAIRSEALAGASSAPGAVPFATPPGSGRAGAMHGDADARPHWSGALFGRQAELDTLERLLPGARIVTLVGPGGVGKSRLAAALVERLEHDPTPRYDRIRWHDLAALETDGAAAALGDLDPGGGGATLVVLDTCDAHLDALAPSIASIVARRPGVTILATSRERLAVARETVMVVEPLGTLRDGGTADDAVALFLDRAREAAPTWSPGEADLDAVAELCTDLDGLPLAVEHAAAQRARLTLAELRDVVRRDLAALGTGSRGGPARHRSLSASFDFGYGRLAPPDRWALRRLAALEGPFSRALAERMLAASPDVSGDDPAATEALLRLVDASLVLLETGPARALAPYRIPRTVAAFAWTDAVRRGESDALADHHAAVVVACAEREAAALSGVEHVAAERRLSALVPDVRRTIGHVGAGRRVGLGLRLAAALFRFWYRRGVPAGADAWLDALLADPRAQDEPPRRVALAVCAAGVCAHARGDARAAVRRFEDAERRLADLGDARGVAEMRTLAALTATRLGDLAGAANRGRAALEVLDGEDSPVDVAVVRSVLAEIAWRRGDVAAAEALFAQALVVLRTARWHALALGNVLRGLGAIAVQRRRFDDAAAYFAEGLALFQGLDHQAAVAVWHSELGCLEFERGRLAAARARFQEALAIHQASGGAAGAAIQMHNLGEVALIEGDAALARLLLARSLEGAPDGATSPRGIRSLCFLAEAHIQLDQPYRARRQLDACLALAEGQRDPSLGAHAHGALGLLELVSGDPDAARAALGRSLAGWRAADDDPRGLRFAELALCLLARSGETDAARELEARLAPLRDGAPRLGPLESRLRDETRALLGREGAIAEPAPGYPARPGDALAEAERLLAERAQDGP